VPGWIFLGGLAAGASLLVGRGALRRAQRRAAADAAGLEEGGDLSHLPPALQRSALWAIAEGGFERRVVRGTAAREHADVAVTGFDLETLRERRGEWAYLPIEPPFRIAGVVSVAACSLDRDVPHVLLKRAGLGDKLVDDDLVARATSATKIARTALGVPRSYPAELPAALPAAPVDLELPEQWRGYTRAPDVLGVMLSRGLRAKLATIARRDLVVELVDRLVLVYFAAREPAGPDALADLLAIALALADALVDAGAITPRGREPRTA
jgi:hypothetical protein